MSSESDLILNGLNLQPNYGALLLGCLLSSALWGISSMQLFMYFLNYERDPKILKCFVVLIWLLDTAAQILKFESLWPVLILHWGRAAGILEFQPGLVHVIYVNGLIYGFVQFFFLWRIYVFSGRNWIFPGLILPLSIWCLVGTIPYSIIAFRSPGVNSLFDKTLSSIGLSYKACAAAADILISLTMTFLLRTRQKSTQSRRLISRLITASIITGAWTALGALIVLILLATKPLTLEFCIVEFPLAPIYVNSLLGNLNSRRYFRERQGPVQWSRSETGNVSSNTVAFGTAKAVGSGARPYPASQTEGQIELQRMTSITQGPESESSTNFDTKVTLDQGVHA